MTTAIFMMLKEILMSVLGKLPFKVIGERFTTRLIIYSLNKLKSMSTNEVVDDTVNDIINNLKGKKLAVIDKGI